MNNEINLMPEARKQTSPVFKKRILLRRISIVLMFFISFLSITLFILIALSPLPSLKQREEDETKRMSFFNEMIIKFRMTKSRINDIAKLLEVRPVYADTINSISNYLPDNAEIIEVHLNEKALSLSIASVSLASLDSFLEKLTAKDNISKNFKKITLVSLKKDFEKGQFVLTIKLI